MKRRFGLLLSLACVLIAVFHVVPVFATVPVVTDVTAWTRQGDNHTILNITVVHGGYFSGHYVNWVQVNISGIVQTISMTDTSPVDQTMSSTFVVPYDMGVVTDTPTVQAQANCNVHGPSTWSVALTLPEFSSLPLVLFLAILTVTTLLLSSRSRKGRSKVPTGSFASNQMRSS